jgi:ferredoxin like protein
VIQTDLSERLGLVGYRNQGRSDAVPHITVDTNVCSKCPHHGTLHTCPARCYTLDADGQVKFEFEDCIECGTCLYVCDQGAVTWKYPDPERGRGVNWALG